jgi:hypothetical protein
MLGNLLKRPTPYALALAIAYLTFGPAPAALGSNAAIGTVDLAAFCTCNICTGKVCNRDDCIIQNACDPDDECPPWCIPPV